jgi:hypothetical protein
MSLVNTTLFGQQNADFNYSYNVVDQSNNPVNLTGMTIKASFKKSYTWPDEWNFNVTVTQVNPGIIALNVPNATMQTLTPGRYVFDVLGETTTSGITTVENLLGGIFIVLPGVTTP